MGTTPICLRAIFVLAWENRWKITNLNHTIENTSTDWSEKKIARFLLEKIANVNKPQVQQCISPCIYVCTAIF